MCSTTKTENTGPFLLSSTSRTSERAFFPAAAAAAYYRLYPLFPPLPLLPPPPLQPTAIASARSCETTSRFWHPPNPNNKHPPSSGSSFDPCCCASRLPFPPCYRPYSSVTSKAWCPRRRCPPRALPETTRTLPYPSMPGFAASAQGKVAPRDGIRTSTPLHSSPPLFLCMVRIFVSVSDLRSSSSSNSLSLPVLPLMPLGALHRRLSSIRLSSQWGGQSWGRCHLTI